MSTSGQFIYTEELYQLPNRVIVLLPVPWAALSEDDVVLLRKILASVRVSLESVQIITNPEINVSSLRIFNPSLVVAFGTQFTPAVTSYQSLEQDGVRLIQSDSLSQLDDVKKKNLWNALKQAFSA